MVWQLQEAFGTESHSQPANSGRHSKRDTCGSYMRSALSKLQDLHPCDESGTGMELAGVIHGSKTCMVAMYEYQYDIKNSNVISGAIVLSLSQLTRMVGVKYQRCKSVSVVGQVILISCCWHTIAEQRDVICLQQ